MRGEKGVCVFSLRYVSVFSEWFLSLVCFDVHTQHVYMCVYGDEIRVVVPIPYPT